MPPNKHYKYGPSSSSRWVRCPGSVLGDPPEKEETVYMAEGTEAHGIAEQFLRNRYVKFPNDEMERAIKEYDEFVSGLPKGQRHIELMVESETFKNRKGDPLGGTMDHLVVTPEELYVTDFKYGKNPVSAVDNTQLMCYLCLAREVYPGRKRFFGSIVQPRVGSPQMQEYTAGALDEFLVKVMWAIESSYLCAGEHCRWCPLLGSCDTEKAYREELVGLTFAEDTPTEKYLAVLAHADVIGELVKIAKHKLLALALAGEKIPGWKLIRSLGNRAWTDPAKAHEGLKEAGLTPDQMYDMKLKSPSKMEKRVGKELVSELCHRPDRGVTIVLSSSRAPEYNPSEMFDEENE